MKTEQEMNAIISRLKALYPDAMCSLDYEKDYELLFSVRLAAQCTDARVNLVTPALFARFPRLEDYAVATPEEVGEYIRSCGFWRAKARDIVACAQQLLARFGGRVPDNMDDLLSLPGVGRKTANLILGDIYGQEGYVCDTHCIRITGRLGITDGSKDPDYYKKEYAAQLRLYRHAFALRLGVPVTRLTIYSFALEQEIDIPLSDR